MNGPINNLISAFCRQIKPAASRRSVSKRRSIAIEKWRYVDAIEIWLNLQIASKNSAETWLKHIYVAILESKRLNGSTQESACFHKVSGRPNGGSRMSFQADGHLSGVQFMGFIIPVLGWIFAFAILTVRGIDKLAVSDPSPNLQSEWVPLFSSYSSLINMSFAHISINLPQAIFFLKGLGFK